MQKNDSDNFWLHKGGCLWIGETICICLILSFCHQNQFSKSLVSLDMLLVDFSMTREKPQNATHPKALSSNCFQSSFDVQHLKPFLKSFKLLSRLLFFKLLFLYNYYSFETINRKVDRCGWLLNYQKAGCEIEPKVIQNILNFLMFSTRVWYPNHFFIVVLMKRTFEMFYIMRQFFYLLQLTSF